MDNVESPIMNLNRERSLSESIHTGAELVSEGAELVPNDINAENTPRNTWDVNTPIERRGLIIGDAIARYNRDHKDDMVFLQNDRPVQINVENGKKVSIVTLDYQQIKTVLSKGAIWTKTAKIDGKITTIETNPTRDLAEWTISAGRRELPNVPVLRGVTAGFLITKDWRFIHTAGYDEKSGFYLINDYQMDPIPMVPTEEDVKEARMCFWDIFQEVQFKDKEYGEDSVNYQNTIFSTISAALRPTWGGGMPITVIKKSSPRIGGSLLAEVIGIYATGSAIIKIPYPDNAHEYTTKLETAIIQHARYVSIDNVTNKYSWSSSCPTLLSQSTGDGRVDLRLFRNNTSLTTCEPETSFTLNGNNIDITKDVCGRIIPIYLESNKDWQKLVFDIEEEELRQKAIILYPKGMWSIAVLYQNWVAHGYPEPKKCNGNFSAYQNLWRVVGGMMQCAGYNKVLDNLKEAQMDFNEADNRIADFLNALGREFPNGQKFTLAQIGETLTYQAQEKRRRYNADTKTFGDDDQLHLINNAPQCIFGPASNAQLSPDFLGTELTKNYLDIVVNGSMYILRKKKSNGVMMYWLEDRHPKN